ncbi:MAG TPA: hypothetical protein VMB75_05920 [Rhodocyclaceae bacterium]|nr:hypothetical protein [Rhodocyclaceae bacterium]
MSLDEETSSDGSARDERRVNVRIRQIFVEAYDVVEPFFDPANQWGGRTHEHLAYRALHERFPDMTANEVFIIVTAAKRVFAAGGRPA